MLNMAAFVEWLHITMEVGFKKLHECVDLLLHVERHMKDDIALGHAYVA